MKCRTAQKDSIICRIWRGPGTPQMNTADRGVIYGLTMDTARGALVRAALEGIAYDMRLNVENMEACGLPVNRILAAGGGARSEKRCSGAQ